MTFGSISIFRDSSVDVSLIVFPLPYPAPNKSDGNNRNGNKLNPRFVAKPLMKPNCDRNGQQHAKIKAPGTKDLAEATKKAEEVHEIVWFQSSKSPCPRPRAGLRLLSDEVAVMAQTFCAFS